MKIKKIEVKNFKAISDEIINFNGCSAIITAGNNKGKTSLLRGLIDRFRGEKAEIILKCGENKGYSILELTDGSKIEWKFTGKTESFSYTTADGIKMTTGVLRAIGVKYFGAKFDIDNFLNMSSRLQTKELSKLVGLDFEKIDSEFKLAYENRKDANKELDIIIKNKIEKPTEIIKPDIQKIKDELAEAEAKNSFIEEDWNKKNVDLENKIKIHNEISKNKHDLLLLQNSELEKLVQLSKNDFFGKCIDIEQAIKIINQIEKPNFLELFTPLPIPEYIPTKSIYEKINQAYSELGKFESHAVDVARYNEWVERGKVARENVEYAKQRLLYIEAEKQEMISGANIPEEFEFTEDGILYNGFPLTSNQVSSSSKYIAALKLGAMAIGEVKTLHFDASFLDNNSLSLIQAWAIENNLQLLLERPDMDGGNIKYEIINNDA